MSKMIVDALLAEATAQEAKAMANLNVYINNPVGVGEHPDVVAECKQLIQAVQEARELRETVNSLFEFNKEEEESND